MYLCFDDKKIIVIGIINHNLIAYILFQRDYMIWLNCAIGVKLNNSLLPGQGVSLFATFKCKE